MITIAILCVVLAFILGFQIGKKSERKFCVKAFVYYLKSKCKNDEEIECEISELKETVIRETLEKIRRLLNDKEFNSKN